MATYSIRFVLSGLAICWSSEATLRSPKEIQRASGQALLHSGSPAAPLSVGDDDWAKPVQDSLSNFGLIHAPREADDQDAKEKAAPAPIRTQVPEKDVDALLDSLSPDCARRVETMLRGDGPPIHTFGSNEVNATAPNCHRMHGCLCENRIYVEKIRTSAENRAVKETVEITGESCLPIECTRTESDLRGISGFFRDQARESLGSTTTHLELHVDCTATAGSQKVSLGTDEPPPVPPPPPPAKPVPAEARSGASRAAGAVAVTMALTSVLSV